MDCLRCLEEGAELVKIFYGNEDTHTIYLCERCIDYFGDGDSVKEIELVREYVIA